MSANGSSRRLNELAPTRTEEMAALFAEALAPALLDRVAAELADRLEQPPPLLDTEGAARYLAVDADTVRKLARAGELPVIRLGSGPKARLRFDPKALREQLSGHGNGTE